MGEHRHRTDPPYVRDLVNRPPAVEVIQVVRVEFRRGEGCCAEDPARECTAYYSLDGDLLAVHDPCAPEATPPEGTASV